MVDLTAKSSGGSSSMPTNNRRKKSRRKFWSRDEAGRLSDIEENSEAIYKPASVVKSGDSID